jgi:hypothetical protein
MPVLDDQMIDLEIETVEDTGHRIVEEQPDLVRKRQHAFLGGAR